LKKRWCVILTLFNKYGKNKKISLVIPTLNESKNIKEIFPKIPDFIDEIIVVDGNSIDGTREEIFKFNKNAKIIVEKPIGKGAALDTGFRNASGDLIIMMDADGSHDPDEIRALLDPVLDGFDVSTASRMLPGAGSDDITAFRRFGNRVFVSMVNSMFGANYTDICYGYRAFKKEALEKINCCSIGFEIETEQCIRMRKKGLRVKEVPSFEGNRKNGNSNLNSIKDGWRIFKIILKEYFNEIHNDKVENKI